MENIFVHGLGQSASSWNNVINKPDIAGEIITPDLVDLIQNKETTYENIYSMFSEMFSSKIGKLRICALSLGAVLALNYTIDHPEKVNS